MMEENTYFEYSIKYKIKDEGEIIVKTRNLEAVAVGVALAINPNDDDFKHLYGKSALHPFGYDGEEMPIITSDTVYSGISIIVPYPFLNQNRMNEFGRKFAGMKMDEVPNSILNDLNMKELCTNITQVTSNMDNIKFVCWKCIKKNNAENAILKGSEDIMTCAKCSRCNKTVTEYIYANLS